VALKDFTCDNCGRRELDQLVRMDATMCCPSCGVTMRNLFSAPTIVLGQGFHRHMSWAKPSKTIIYQDGHIAHRTHNEMYETGGL